MYTKYEILFLTIIFGRIIHTLFGFYLKYKFSTQWVNLRIKRHTGWALRQGSRYQIGWFFWKVPKGRGSFSIQRFISQILETLNRAFWVWNWHKQSKIRVQGMFFFFKNCIEKNQNKAHFEEGFSSHTPTPHSASRGTQFRIFWKWLFSSFFIFRCASIS